MTVDTERLRQLATAATPGPWDRSLMVPGRIGHLTARETWYEVGQVYTVQDTDFVLAANPTTVLAMLDRIETLKGLLREAADALDDLDFPDDWFANTSDIVDRCRAVLDK